MMYNLSTVLHMLFSALFIYIKVHTTTLELLVINLVNFLFYYTQDAIEKKYIHYIKKRSN